MVAGLSVRHGVSSSGGDARLTNGRRQGTGTGRWGWRQEVEGQQTRLEQSVGGLELDVNQWAEQQFGECELGDARRTQRLVKYAAQVATRPDASTPQQTKGWGDCKAAYRLFACEKTTFEAVARPHWKQTRACQPGTYLVIGDTTQIEFGIWRNVSGLSPTGDGRGRGFLLHSALMVDAHSEAIVGLAGQTIHHRQPRSKKDTKYKTRQGPRESDIWGRVIEEVGSPPSEAQFIHVFDRGADNFEVYARLLLARGEWIVRAGQLERKVQFQGQELPLVTVLPRLEALGSYELTWRVAGQRGTRTAKLEIRVGTLGVPTPRMKSRWVRERGFSLITMNVVEVREIDPPAGVEPLHWVLLTSLPVTSFSAAWRVIEYYEKRPLIEEFHKALKTGCRVEERYYQTSARLEALVGLLSVVAVRLVQLKRIAQIDPQRPASAVVPPAWLWALEQRFGRKLPTVRDFFRALARLGGFLGRKSDGEPGWITLWRGTQTLLPMLEVPIYETKKCG